MYAIAQDVRTMWAVAVFLSMGYLGYVCMYLAPTDHLRRWGGRTWWRRFQHGPVWPQQVGQPGAQAEDLLGYRAVIHGQLAAQSSPVGLVSREDNLPPLQLAFAVQHLNLTPLQQLARPGEGDNSIWRLE